MGRWTYCGCFELLQAGPFLQAVMYAHVNVLFLFRPMQGVLEKPYSRINHLQVRPWTFFENGVVGHIGFADPFDNLLRSIIIEALQGKDVLEGENATLHDSGTLICMGSYISCLHHSATSTYTSVLRFPSMKSCPVQASQLLNPFQKAPNSPPAPNPSSTAPGPPPASTCPACRKLSLRAKPSLATQ